ncbi:peptide deformylase [Dyadobacter sp. CY347]|uniref:peptide deformylase n=1 Tax=Dyadobacter sp. CY347 TaxID=2909336 RepID=UPI001F1C10D8|nr:peptide deformylase [Dyadobacter sp. CY347]MCF2487518.1 peptide deformylase [Dyadobacter sp. CY347]
MKNIIELSKEDFISNNILRKVSKIVEHDDPQITQDILELIQAFESSLISVGLSAPQIGIFKRIIVVNIKKDQNPDHIVMINPEIIQITGSKKIMKETCLSLPNFRGPVQRKDKVRVKYLGMEGNVKIEDYTGFMSRVIQHEIDHLLGVLYVDRMNSLSLLESVN